MVSTVRVYWTYSILDCDERFGESCVVSRVRVYWTVMRGLGRAVWHQFRADPCSGEITHVSDDVLHYCVNP